MIKVKTHLASNETDKQCEFCDRAATYFSQKADTKTYQAYSLVVWHCQRHRAEGRAKAEQGTREDVLESRRRLLERLGEEASHDFQRVA